MTLLQRYCLQHRCGMLWNAGQPYGIMVHDGVNAAAGAAPARLLAQIHDELLFEVPDAQVAATTAAVRRIMEGASEAMLRFRLTCFGHSIKQGCGLGRLCNQICTLNDIAVRCWMGCAK